MDEALKQSLATYLAQFVTEPRRHLIEAVLAQRTRHITVMLENIFQPHNASAVLRSCDCFGVQDVHVVEDENEYRINRDVALGSNKWLTLHRYRTAAKDNTARCIEALRHQGYRIVATTLAEGAIPLHSLPIDHKLALCFGTEEHGLSPVAHELADTFVHIPMVGFTQSFNISVSAALCLYDLTHRLRRANVAWQLSEAEQLTLRIEWLRQSATREKALMRHFYRAHNLAIPEELLEEEED